MKTQELFASLCFFSPFGANWLKLSQFWGRGLSLSKTQHCLEDKLKIRSIFTGNLFHISSIRRNSGSFLAGAIWWVISSYFSLTAIWPCLPWMQKRSLSTSTGKIHWDPLSASEASVDFDRLDNEGKSDGSWCRGLRNSASHLQKLRQLHVLSPLCERWVERNVHLHKEDDKASPAWGWWFILREVLAKVSE